MDFAWVVDALRRGLKVTRKAWAGDPPMYLYMVTEKQPNGKHIIKMHTGTSHDFDWTPTAEQILTVDDWEEYVEPKVRREGPFVINPLPFTTTMEMRGGEPVDESWPELKKVWTTYWDLDIQITGALIDKADYPYTLCERDVIEQKRDKLVVLAEPGFSQRTVTLHLNENCWMNAKDASASLIHRLTNRFGWNTEFFISLLNGIEYTDGDWCKPCSEGDNRSLGDLFVDDMEFLAQEQARVAHCFYYIINQYLRLAQTTAPERQRRDILDRCEASMRQHRTVLDGLSKKDTNQEKED